MFSGKTYELIQRVMNARVAGASILIVTPQVDGSSGTSIASRSGLSLPAVAVAAAPEIQALAATIDVVAIDEAQFFDPELIDVALQLADAGKRVVVSGLDLDFRRRPFGCMAELLSAASYVDKLQAVCERCGDVACYSQRLVDGRPAAADEPTIAVGASAFYEARCRTCYTTALDLQAVP
jgi:thymidine kinase